MIKLFHYQINAVDGLLEKLLETNSKNPISYSAPTGSGKTIVLSKLVERLRQNIHFCDYTFLFIAPSTGEIYKQSWQKFDNTFNNNKSELLIKNSYLTTNELKKGIIYFAGWAQLSNNTIIRNTNREQTYTSWTTLLKNTNSNKTKVLLIVDEQHTGIGEEMGKVIEQLKPAKILEVSATLSATNILGIELSSQKNKSNSKHEYITFIDEVKQSRAVKQNLEYNNILALKSDDKSIVQSKEDFILRQSILKQKEVKKAIKDLNIKIDNEFFNPLLLIQLPTSKNELNDKESKNIKNNQTHFKNFVQNNEQYINTLKEEKLSYAIWTSNVKKIFKYDNLTSSYIEQNKTASQLKDLIKDNNSFIDVLFFKFAVATGWDVPRANILTKLKDTIADENVRNNFLIQTVGRIFRNPFLANEFNNRPDLKNLDDNHILNKAFVFGLDKEVPNNLASYFGGSVINSKNANDSELKIVKMSNKIEPNLIQSIYSQIHEPVNMDNEMNELISYISLNLEKIKGQKLEVDESIIMDENLFADDTQQFLNLKLKLEKKEILNTFLGLSHQEQYLNLLENIYMHTKNESLFLQTLIYSNDKILTFINVLNDKTTKMLKSTKKFKKFNIPNELKLLEHLTVDDNYNTYEKWYRNEANDQLFVYEAKDKYVKYKWESQTGHDLYKDLHNIRNKNKKLDYNILHNIPNQIKYYINYYNENTKRVSRWYPDFIIYNDKKIVCLDAKNNDKSMDTFAKLEELELLQNEGNLKNIEFYFTERFVKDDGFEKSKSWYLFNNRKQWASRKTKFNENLTLKEIILGEFKNE